MNFEISMLTKQPDWKKWGRLGSVTLNQAIFLSMDICPEWWGEYILAGIQNLNDDSGYGRLYPDSEIAVIKKAHELIEPEFLNRLHIAQSWATKQDWIIGPQPILPNQIFESSYVDLKKFTIFAFAHMGYENQEDCIPKDFKTYGKGGNLEQDQGSKRSPGRPESLTSEQKAALIQKRKDNPNISHDTLAEEFGVKRRTIGNALKKAGIN